MARVKSADIKTEDLLSSPRPQIAEYDGTFATNTQAHAASGTIKGVRRLPGDLPHRTPGSITTWRKRLKKAYAAASLPRRPGVEHNHQLGVRPGIRA